MLVLRFLPDDSITLTSGRSSLVLTPADLTVGVPTAYQFRKPRPTGTHGVFCVVLYWIRKGKPVVGITSDNGVKVQHSMMEGTEAGKNWKKPR